MPPCAMPPNTPGPALAKTLSQLSSQLAERSPTSPFSNPYDHSSLQNIDVAGLGKYGIIGSMRLRRHLNQRAMNKTGTVGTSSRICAQATSPFMRGITTSSDYHRNFVKVLPKYCHGFHTVTRDHCTVTGNCQRTSPQMRPCT